MWHLTACKISVSLSFLYWIKNEMIFYRTSELMLAILIQRYGKNHFIFYPVQERETNWNFTGCQVPHLMFVLIPHIYLSNLSWIIKCLFWGNMEASNQLFNLSVSFRRILAPAVKTVSMYLITKRFPIPYPSPPPQNIYVWSASHLVPQYMFFVKKSENIIL